MNNKQFIAEVARRMGYSAQDTQKMVYQVVDAMVESFQEGNVVTIMELLPKILSDSLACLTHHETMDTGTAKGGK